VRQISGHVVSGRQRKLPGTHGGSWQAGGKQGSSHKTDRDATREPLHTFSAQGLKIVYYSSCRLVFANFDPKV
jgi:hypothetical protein